MAFCFLPPVFCLTFGVGTLYGINAVWTIPNNWLGIVVGCAWLLIGAAVAVAMEERL